MACDLHNLRVTSPHRAYLAHPSVKLLNQSEYGLMSGRCVSPVTVNASARVNKYEPNLPGAYACLLRKSGRAKHGGRFELRKSA